MFHIGRLRDFRIIIKLRKLYSMMAISAGLFLASCTGLPHDGIIGGGNTGSTPPGGNPIDVNSTPSGAKPIDGEGIQGRSIFLHSATAKIGTFVAVSGSLTPSVERFQYDEGVITSLGDIDPSLLEVSLDKTALTVKGDTSIYELLPQTLDTIIKASAPLPPPKIESLCFASPVGQGTPIGQTGYTNFRIRIPPKMVMILSQAPIHNWSMWEALA